MPGPCALDALYAALPAWLAPFRRDGGARAGGRGDDPGALALRAGARAPDLMGRLDGVTLRHLLGAAAPDVLPGLGAARPAALAAAVRRHADPATGRFTAPGSLHFWEHVTAYANAALVLLTAGDGAPGGAAAAGPPPASRAGPEAPPLDLLPRLARPGAMARWLESCGWDLFWPGSHQVGGVAAVAHLQGAAPSWFEPWLGCLEAWVDPASGLWCRGLVHRLKPPGVHELAGAAHLWWVFAHRGRPLPHPEAIVDTALRLQRPGGTWGAGLPFCRELDGVWALVTASDQAGGYRAAAVEAACARTLGSVTAALGHRPTLFGGYRTTHRLVGALAAAALVQRRYPGLLRTPAPLRCPLDVVPWL